MPYIVVDLDNTLCDVGHRIEFARAKDWEEFHARCYLDRPNADVFEALRMLPKEIQIIALTGRPEKYRLATWQWFRERDVKIDHLVMRPDDNRDGSAVLKPAMLQEFFSLAFGYSSEEAKRTMLCEVIFMLDDRSDVIAAFRKLGLACWQVREEL